MSHDKTLDECKQDALKAMVAAHSALQDLYYREDMLSEPAPTWMYDLEGAIQRLRRELAGA